MLFYILLSDMLGVWKSVSKNALRLYLQPQYQDVNRVYLPGRVQKAAPHSSLTDGVV